MCIQLSSTDYDYLRGQYKKEKDKKRAERINIILLLHKGYSQAQVSDILNLDQDTISKWKIAFENREDIDSWLSTHYVSYFGKMSTFAMSQLRQYILTFKVSDKKELVSYLANSLGINYGLSGLQKLLKRLKFSHQTIVKLPGKCPIEKQSLWVENFETKLANPNANEIILFGDSVHPTHNSRHSKIWTLQGQPRYIQSNTGREHLNICGLYSIDSQEFIYQQAETVNAQTFIELLKMSLQKYEHKTIISIYVDNAKYHKNQAVKDFLAQQSKIKLYFLPPYSPNLNPIERLWKFVNQKIINLNFYPSFKEFKAKIIDFYDTICQHADELKNRITYKFQLFSENAT